MTGELHIPNRGPDQPILEALDDVRHTLDGEDRAVTHELLKEQLLAEGRETIGEVIAGLESMERSERRELVERARGLAGLESLASVEFEAEQRRREAAAPPRRDGNGCSLQVCHEPTCRAFPVDQHGGHAPHPARKWWCDQHRHLAADGDMDPWRSSLRWTPGPRDVIDIEELKADRERERAELESRRVRREANQAEREEEAAALARYERAAEEQRRRESPAGLP